MIPFIQPIKDRLEKITPGPWEFIPNDGEFYSYIQTKMTNEELTPNDDDLKFVAYSPSDMKRLIEAVEILYDAVEIGSDSSPACTKALEKVRGL